MTTLLELAARCEAAERGGHELNLAIFRALNPEYADEETWRPYGLGVRHKYDSSDARCLPPSEATAASYTTSLDAAMTLVPENWRVGSMGETVIEGDDPWNVRLLEKRFDGRAKRADGDAATPALALCAASLKARANSSPEGTRE